jgi:erythromycin esterase-like protein
MLPPKSKLREHLHRYSHTPADHAQIVDWIGDARLVLIGEASHGTHEFYRERAQITKRLIRERGFHAVAVEADWPDAYRVNCFVQGDQGIKNADSALAGFKRFPSWMWRNTEVLEFASWLRSHNASRAANHRAGFYGLDLYSLHTSIEAVLKYLDKVDPEAASRARYRYSCFDQSGEDPQSYGYAAEFGLKESCENETVEQLLELQRNRTMFVSRDGNLAHDNQFFAEQNARLVRNAERYYRSMFRGNVESWNVRDSHMVETLQELLRHLRRITPAPKVVVWAHNSHLGDARATRMGHLGEHNVGQLVRERYHDECFLLGFSTHSGTVTAASDWGGAAERKFVRPSLSGSYEALFHAVAEPAFAIDLRSPHVPELRQPRLERAIGVIYRPDTERASHYFQAKLAEQFDAIIHIDQTTALAPLERNSIWDRGELPETYPSAV